MPKVISDSIINYLAHTSGGKTLRSIARTQNCHPSTVLRQVRRIEAKRDDPLFDEALLYASTSMPPQQKQSNATETPDMPAEPARLVPKQMEDQVDREARRILRRLCEKNAFLVVAADRDKAAVFREVVPGHHNRIAVVERAIARGVYAAEAAEGDLFETYSARFGD